MSVYRIKVEGRSEFVMKCDACGWRTTSLEDKKGYMAHYVVCPNCNKPIDMKMMGEVPYPFDDYI